MRQVSAQWKTTREVATAAASASSGIHANPKISVYGRSFSSSSTCVTVSTSVDRLRSLGDLRNLGYESGRAAGRPDDLSARQLLVEQRAGKRSAAATTGALTQWVGILMGGFRHDCVGRGDLFGGNKATDLGAAVQTCGQANSLGGTPPAGETALPRVEGPTYALAELQATRTGGRAVASVAGASERSAGHFGQGLPDRAQLTFKLDRSVRADQCS